MNKTTERRLKLFDDAAHYGAEIIDTPGWTCAICRTYDQMHCFGRGKPKTGPDGEIDPECNRRDDEGIDPIHAARRDSNAPWVRDGIGFDDQPFEAGWCVAGGDRGFPGSTLAWHPDRPCSSYAHGDCYASAKKPGEQCPYLVFLEHDTGKLYISNLQYSRYGMMHLKDGWVVSDYNCERNGYTEGGVQKRIENDDQFAEIFQKAADASLRGLTGAPDHVDVRNPDPAPRPAYPVRFAPVSKPVALTVRSLYAAVYGVFNGHVGLNTKLVWRGLDGKTRPVTRIAEGVGSRMEFKTDGTGRVVLVDFVEYIRGRIKDDRKFQHTTVYGPNGETVSRARQAFGCLELS